MSNLGIASQESTEAINILSDGLQGIPTTLDDAALATQRFTSKNGDVKKSVNLFLAVNNALLAGGASADIQSSAMEQLSQAYAKGKPDMIEWRSLQTAMPAQLKQISKEILGNKDSLDIYLKKAKEYADNNPLSSTAKELVEQLEEVKSGSGDMTTALGTALRTGIISMDEFMDTIVKLNKEGTGEFLSFEEQAKNSTGGIKTSITNAKTAITRGVASIVTSFNEMLKNNGLGGLSTVINKIGKTSENVLKKIADLIPKIVSKIKDMYEWIKRNKDLVKNLIIVIASLTAGYIAYQKTLVAIKAIQTAKNIISTTTAFLSLIPSIRSAKDAMLLLNMTFSANPVGLVVAGVVALTTALVAFSLKGDSAKKSMENIATGFKEFYDGINNANSHLESFNSTLFASSEEQQKLQSDMDNVQKGITQICKKASDERRDYTEKEIKQLDEYFTKLRELKDKELEIQKSISKSITNQAEQYAQTFQGTLEEYKVNSQEWIKTAEEQRDKEIQLINDRTTQEIALLQQRYGEKANMENEEYAREFNKAQENKNKAIQEANDEVAKVTEAYNNGYTERAKQQDGFFQKLQEHNQKIQSENEENANKLKEIEENKLLVGLDKNLAIEDENNRHKKETKKIWEEMYKNMSDEEAKELGSWLARQAHSEMYGGKISDENQNMVDAILDSYEDMPKKTRKSMEDAMKPMLEEMEKKEPSLFSKAFNIADGICKRLRKAFDEHSPSKKTRKIFKYAMEGAELGLEDEKDNLMKQIDDISENVIRKMQNAVALETGSINAKASIKSNNSMINVIQANFNVDGSVNIDGQKAGRIITPYMTKTLRTGGAY